MIYDKIVETLRYTATPVQRVLQALGTHLPLFACCQFATSVATNYHNLQFTGLSIIGENLVVG